MLHNKKKNNTRNKNNETITKKEKQLTYENSLGPYFHL